MTFREYLRVTIFNLITYQDTPHNPEETANDIIERIDMMINSCLEEQSKYHEDYAEGLHRLQEMLKR